MTLRAREISHLLGLPSPTPEQVAVIEAPLRPLLVVAGAGSGKTETMTARVVYLVANGLVAREQVLGLTFTRKAAGELADRVRRRLRALDRRVLDRRADGGVSGGAAEQPLLAPTIATYNSYAAALVTEHALRLGMEPATRLLGEAGRWQLAHEVVTSWPELDTDLSPATITTAVLDLADDLADHLVAPEELAAAATRWADRMSELAGHLPQQLRRVRDSLRLRGALADLVRELTARKRAADLMDFADQVALAARLAREVPEVGAAERLRFPVVLLDEYQDTSVAQLELLRALFSEHPVTAVGDPHQSIYGWRGASSGGLERFGANFAGGYAATLTLSTSWRNDAAVLTLANRVAEPLRAGSRLPLPVLAARPEAGAGEVAVAFTADIDAEARLVADFISQRRTPGVTAAVLCRRRDQFAALQTALRAAGLPVEVVGLGGLLQTPEVVDLVAALEAAHDPSRGDSLMRLLTGPRARLGLSDLYALADWAAAASSDAGEGLAPAIVEALDELPQPGWVSRHGRALSTAGRQRLSDLGELLRGLRSQTFLPVADLVAVAERLLGLDIEVAARGGPVGPARANLDAFRRVAAEFDDTEGGTLGAFLAWLDAALQEERGLEAPVAEPDPNAVQVMTVHAAKGLEWDLVALPGLVAGVFPGPARSPWVVAPGALPTPLRGDRDSLPQLDLAGAADLADLTRRVAQFRDRHQEHELMEERRLAYVAVTRARRHLLLTGSRWRAGVRPVDPSPFLVAAAEHGDVLEWSVAAGRPESSAPAARWPVAAGAGHTGLVRAAAAVRAAPGDAGGELAELADLLLAERASRSERPRAGRPRHLSASALVQLATDPAAFELQRLRPIPVAPSQRARRGTAFHAWVERYFGLPALVDVDELPGVDDDGGEADADLARLQAAFLASPWAARTPVAVEVDVETPVAGVVLRCRIDAVFTEADGRTVVVDWKTGRPPDTANAQARELQLAVYRLAWSRWREVPLERVEAAFYYVATGETVHPAADLDEQRIVSLLAQE